MPKAVERSPNLHRASKSFCQVTSGPCSIQVWRTARHFESAGCGDGTRSETSWPTPRAYAMKSHFPPICAAKKTRISIVTSGRFAGTVVKDISSICTLRGKPWHSELSPLVHSTHMHMYTHVYMHTHTHRTCLDKHTHLHWGSSWKPELVSCVGGLLLSIDSSKTCREWTHKQHTIQSSYWPYLSFLEIQVRLPIWSVFRLLI